MGSGFFICHIIFKPTSDGVVQDLFCRLFCRQKHHFCQFRAFHSILYEIGKNPVNSMVYRQNIQHYYMANYSKNITSDNL